MITGSIAGIIGIIPHYEIDYECDSIALIEQHVRHGRGAKAIVLLSMRGYCMFDIHLVVHVVDVFQIFAGAP